LYGTPVAGVQGTARTLAVGGGRCCGTVTASRCAASSSAPTPWSSGCSAVKAQRTGQR